MNEEMMMVVEVLKLYNFCKGFKKFQFVYHFIIKYP